ncbi:hypothetical protein MFLAVUS_004867 [Mucor flavus]|uniref:Tc1-like transposase DDE domain-containing protein n=1 Tax=Mucor flavus TaxID=439312 RepID=A0ABP9YX84_9FUNG
MCLINHSKTYFYGDCVMTDRQQFGDCHKKKFSHAARPPTGRAVSHTVLGAITTKFVVSMELRNPQEESSKRIKIDFSNRKRKSPAQKKKPTSKGTATGHYMKFLEKNMDELDCFPELKGYYIVMDNAPIHTADQVDEMIVARGYRSIYISVFTQDTKSFSKQLGTIGVNFPSLSS